MMTAAEALTHRMPDGRIDRILNRIRSGDWVDVTITELSAAGYSVSTRRLQFVRRTAVNLYPRGVIVTHPTWDGYEKPILHVTSICRAPAPQ